MAELLDIGKEITAVLDEFKAEVFANREKALDKASDYLLEQVKQATPTDTGETKNAWERTTKYKAVRYIGNSRMSENGIPVVNMLEYSKNGKPFVRVTFAKNKDKIINIIQEELSK